MPDKTRVDISSENFDNFFASLIPHITPAAKESLPRDIVNKIFRNGATANPKNTSKLNFITKLFILWKAMKKDVFIVVEGNEETGLSPEKFCELKASIKARDFGVDRSRELVAEAVFVTGNKELMQAMAYLNQLSISPTYNYLTKIKGMPVNKVEERAEQAKKIIRFLINYEQAKKKINNQKLLNPPEIYVLLALYHGGEQKGSIIHSKTFKYCYQSSQTKIKIAFGTLQARGLICKTGEGNGARFKITPLGTSAINDLINDYWLNF